MNKTPVKKPKKDPTIKLTKTQWYLAGFSAAGTLFAAVEVDHQEVADRNAEAKDQQKALCEQAELLEAEPEESKAEAEETAKERDGDLVLVEDHAEEAHPLRAALRGQNLEEKGFDGRNVLAHEHVWSAHLRGGRPSK